MWVPQRSNSDQYAISCCDCVFNNHERWWVKKGVDPASHSIGLVH